MLKRMVLANHSTLGNALAVPNQSESRELKIHVSEILFRKIEQLAVTQGVSIDNVVVDALIRYLEIESSALTILQVHQEALRRLGEE